MDDTTFEHLNDWAKSRVYDFEYVPFLEYAVETVDGDPDRDDWNWPTIYRTWRDVEQVKRNERHAKMFQGPERMIHETCPGCGRIFEGRFIIEVGKITFHKGRCKKYKEWNTITDLSTNGR